jgi:bacterioferritin
VHRSIEPIGTWKLSLGITFNCAAPDFDPKNLTSLSAPEYATGSSVVATIRKNLIAERVAVEHYRELIRFFGNDDPATRVMIESILVVEEEHASDLQDLLAMRQTVKSNL